MRVLDGMIRQNERKGFYKPEKSDVYSLGLAILQLITRENVEPHLRKDFNVMLMKKIQEVQISDWVKKMLMGMLQLERHKHLSFAKCLGFIPKSKAITGTIIN